MVPEEEQRDLCDFSIMLRNGVMNDLLCNSAVSLIHLLIKLKN